MDRHPTQTYEVTELQVHERPGREGEWEFGAWVGWVHGPSLEPFGLEFRAELIGGALELTELRIRSTKIGAEAEPIRSTTLRSISTTALLGAIRAEIQARSDTGTWRTNDPAELERVLRAVVRSRENEPRTKLTDRYLRDLAVLRLSLNGQRRPNAQLADRLHVSTATITDHLNRATKAGWLAASKQGVQRREPGPRLNQVASQECDPEEDHEQ